VSLDPTPQPDPAGLDREALGWLDALDHDEGRAHELASNQLTRLRAIFEDRSGLGLYLFSYWVCGCRDLYAPLHLDICRFLSAWGLIKLEGGEVVERPVAEGDKVSQSWRRLMLIVPRESFKSSLATRANCLWRATLDPEITVGIFSESEAKVKSWIGSLKQVIERSELYQVIWPERLPPGLSKLDRNQGVSLPRTWKWGDTGLLLRRESLNISELTFEPFGIGGSHTGKHFTHVVLDDIIGEPASQSTAIMEDAIHFVDHCRPLERPAEGGCQLICCTRWGYHDVYSHMVQKWPNEYRIYQRALLENPETGEPDVVAGRSIFPTRIPTELAKTMYESDPFIFAAQYQCIPRVGRETSFDHDWIHYGAVLHDQHDEPEFVIDRDHYDSKAVHADLAWDDDPPPPRIPLSRMTKAIFFDPAPSKKTERNAEPRARNGIVVLARDPWGRTFVLDAIPLREDPLTVLDHLVVLGQRWATDTIAIEEVNFSAIYAPLWSEILRSRHPTFQIQFIPLKPKGRDKDTRIRSLQGPHAKGLWYYNRPTTGYAIQELVEYPTGQTRDLIDAMAYADDVLSRPLTPGEFSLHRKLQHQVDRGRDPVTGY